MKALRTIILAAGKGTRMKSATPKVLHEICGRSLIDYVLDVTRKVKSEKTCVVLGHGREKVQARLPKGVLTVEQKKLLGTGDAVKTAERYFKGFSGDVLVLCGDTPLLKAETVRALIRRHQSSKAICTLLTTVVENSRSYGRMIRDNSGAVAAIREEIDADEFEKQIKEINVGVYCFQSKALFENLRKVQANNRKGEYYLTDLIKLFSDRGLKVETISTDDPSEGWGVNTREDLAACAAVMRKKILKDFMQEGVTIVDSHAIHIAGNVKIGQDTVIRPFTVIDQDVIIGKNCVIGPFAHLRSGTRIGDTVEVGNFAEVSRSSIGSGSFMKHFSFIGDAEVGKEVNIGAGTITANFNGVTKNKTFVGEGSFIGSDAVLIAPVRIGKKAMVGAGSVVTAGKAVPDGKIFVGAPARLVPGRKAVIAPLVH